MMASYAELPLWITFLLFLPLLIVFRKMVEARNKEKQLPPCPPKLPIIGNLHQLGPLLHQSFCKLSKKYGPVMLVHFGRMPMVIISSAEAAREVMKTNDLASCSRPLLAGTRRITYNYLDVAFSPYGEHWREMKKLVVLELFSVKRVRSFQNIREEEVEFMVNSISEASTSGAPVNLTDKLFALSANITFRMSFGFNYHGSNFDKDRFHEVVHDCAAVAGSFAADEYLSYFGWIIDRISGHHARTERVFRELDTFFQHVIDDHQKPGRLKEREDMIDILLRIEKEQAESTGAEFTIENVKGVLLNLFLGGVDTAAITLNWAMAELARKPVLMKKAQDEVRKCVGNKGRVKESEMDQLEYLKLVIKETLRLHPPAPLLLPRETISHFKINGFSIHPNTLIQVNAWGISRDPKYWKDPEKFIPERFADSSIDFKGQNFKFLPFGAGRRICPAIHMGITTVETALANLLYCFDWKVPDGMKEEDIDMEEQAGISITVSTRTPVKLIPVQYLP